MPDISKYEAISNYFEFQNKTKFSDGVIVGPISNAN